MLFIILKINIQGIMLFENFRVIEECVIGGNKINKRLNIAGRKEEREEGERKERRK